jgi:dolichyl-phosphate-mannose--protein O-mannosyl transferase
VKNELFPIVSGLILGALLPLIRPRMRLAVGVAASVVLGTIATVVSGEYKVGWEFLLIDIPLVAVCSAAAFSTVRAARRRISTARAPR